MALPGYCNHSFNLLKSESTLIQWVCSMCHSGPHWYIFECKYCKLKTCRPCTNKFSSRVLFFRRGKRFGGGWLILIGAVEERS
ncbi:uncharacterized protein K444DRAFT_601540 [Hyaloscypha bicolor E]|uniref:Uncharacterized protein n=1 Tax=Hyaloscypha bicolor E TaxID=1095630 RepID=A0A2J6SKH3_9HELO|nr:uncharacterized protein K444DRAFT_601540 [Hyaloscypha bicolor E]PMD51254.1 hypothetical protein K444DRAFT_601540 [Hyaloscypha bicolor E]